MKVEIGQRYIWEEKEVFIDQKCKGIVTFLNDKNVTISWEDNKHTKLRDIQYDIFSFLNLLNESDPRLRIDKEYYRNEALKKLGI